MKKDVAKSFTSFAEISHILPYSLELTCITYMIHFLQAKSEDSYQMFDRRLNECISELQVPCHILEHK